MTRIMKKYFLSLGLIVAATFTLTNCTEQIDSPVEPVKTPFEIVASTVDTKTAVGDNLSTVWTEGDALNVFHVVSGETEYVNDGKFELSGENVFKGEVSGTFEEDVCYNWYAFYPYKKQITTPANESVENSYTPVGSTGSAAQVQTGNNSMAHISGPNYPLCGVYEDWEYAPEEPVEVTMTHLTSLIEFVVTNKSDEPLVVENISFTATEDIVGTYYVNFADPSNVVFTSSGTNYVSSVAKLNVEDGEEIPVDGTAKFYMAVKPFTASTGQTLKLLINDCEIEKTLNADLSFVSGKIKTINCSYETPQDVLVGISGIKAAADEAGTAGGTFVADVENVVVTYVNGNNAYIQDETAGILIYASGHGLNIGDVLNGRISGSVKIYNNLREITAFTSSATVTTTDQIPVTTLTIAELNANQDKYENMRVELVDVEVTTDGKFSKDGTSVEYYKKGNSVTGLVAYNIVDVIGYPGKYNAKFQLNVWYSPKVKGATQTTMSGFSTELTVGVGNTVTNKATASSGATVSYVSENTAVATVDDNGVVTGVTAGTTTITASVEAYNGYPAASVTCTVTVTADAPSVKYYVKVTSAPTDWSGKYLIVYEGDETSSYLDGSLKPGTSDGQMGKTDAIINIQIENNKIESTATINESSFTIESSGTGYAIKASSGFYMGMTGNSNGLKSANDASAYIHSITLEDNKTVSILSSDGYTKLAYNKSSVMFRYYKTSTISGSPNGYPLPTLYKLED